MFCLPDQVQLLHSDIWFIYKCVLMLLHESVSFFSEPFFMEGVWRLNADVSVKRQVLFFREQK